jgi:hypothetical protein
VDGPTGGTQDYGVYAGPILDILHDQGLQAWPVEGALDGVRSAIVRGHPVIAWVTYNCQTSTPETVSVDGEAVVLVPGPMIPGMARRISTEWLTLRGRWATLAIWRLRWPHRRGPGYYGYLTWPSSQGKHTTPRYPPSRGLGWSPPNDIMSRGPIRAQCCALER